MASNDVAAKSRRHSHTRSIPSIQSPFSGGESYGLMIPVVASTLGLCATVGFLCSSPKWTNLISTQQHEDTRSTPWLGDLRWKVTHLDIETDDPTYVLSPLSESDLRPRRLWTRILVPDYSPDLRLSHPTYIRPTRPKPGVGRMPPIDRPTTTPDLPFRFTWPF